MATSTNLKAYFGGLIDGEGLVKFYHYPAIGKKNFPLIRVAMSDIEPIELLNRHFPSGRVKKEYRTIKVTETGKLRKTLWYWQVAFCKALNFSRVILPYVKIGSKRQTMKEIIKYYVDRNRRKRS